jgi:nicotinamidase-related amidase
MASDQLTVPADPGHFRFKPAHTALLVIDMQRDFVEPGGFGETLGNDVSLLRSVIPPLQKVLAASRAAGQPAW